MCVWNRLLPYLRVVKKSEEMAKHIIKNDFSGHYGEVDLKCAEIATCMSAALTMAYINWSITRRELSACTGNLLDMPIQLGEWAHSLDGFDLAGTTEPGS